MRNLINFRQKLVAIVLCTGPLLLLAAALNEPITTVRFQLLDASGKPTPAMICITSVEDGTVRLPPDGRVNPQPSTTEEFTGGIDFRRGSDWVGPVRKTTGKGDNRDRSYVYESVPSLPY